MSDSDYKAVTTLCNILSHALKDATTVSAGDALELCNAVVTLVGKCEAKDATIADLREQLDKGISLMQQMYLLDCEGRADMHELQDRVADHLFNVMGWSDGSNNFVKWQAEQEDGNDE